MKPGLLKNFSKKQAKMFGQIFGTLQEAIMENDLVAYDSLRGLSNLELAEKEKWLSTVDFFSLFSETCFRLVIKRDEGIETSFSGPLSAVVSRDAMEIAAAELVEFIDGLPHTYWITATIPNFRLKDAHSFEAGGFCFETRLGPPRGLINPSPYEAVIRTNAVGFANYRMESSAAIDGLDKIRTLLGLCLVEGALDVNRHRAEQGGLIFSVANTTKIDRQYIHAERFDSGSNHQVRLPLDFSVTMLSLEAHSGFTTGRTELEIVEELSAIFRKADFLFTLNDNHARSIASACQWLFNSWVGENETLSFLQVCFGFEALFGEKNRGAYPGEPDPGIIYSISTKCAFAVAEKISQRKSVIDSFRALYTARSGIVHGSKSRLDEKEKKHFHWGRTMLAAAIRVEINRF